MAKLMRNNGYTIIEMIFILIFITIFMLCFLFNVSEYRNINLIKEKDIFKNHAYNLILAKQISILNMCKKVYYVDKTKVTFNSFGYINKAITIKIGENKLILNLGNGNMYEK